MAQFALTHQVTPRFVLTIFTNVICFLRTGSYKQTPTERNEVPHLLSVHAI